MAKTTTADIMGGGGVRRPKAVISKWLAVAPGVGGSSCFAVAAFATTCGQLHVCGECCQAAREQAQGSSHRLRIKDLTVKIAVDAFPGSGWESHWGI